MGIDTATIKGTPVCTLHTSPLGVRFWDKALQTVITGGLNVVAYPEANSEQRMEGISNPSGVFVFHNLPGLQDFEYRGGERDWQQLDPWTETPDQKPFTIEVRDRMGRFIPILLNVKIPQRGLYLWEQRSAASPPEPAVPFVPLFSAVTRTVVPGMAVLRADLWDPQTERPAAHALIEASYDGALLAQGVADSEGRVLIIFPFPEPARQPLSLSPVSPPRSPRIIPLRDQEWKIDLRAFYRSDSHLAAMPDLKALCEQPVGMLWQDKTLHEEMDHTFLQFGKESILRTKNGAEKLPVLYLTSAVSPP